MSKVGFPSLLAVSVTPVEKVGVKDGFNSTRMEKLRITKAARNHWSEIVMTACGQTEYAKCNTTKQCCWFKQENKQHCNIDILHEENFHPQR